MKLLWLDDIRNPFDGDWIKKYAPRFENDGEIIWVKNYNDFIQWIIKNDLPYMIAFDHDLGEDVAKAKVAKGMSKKQARLQKKEAISGYECAKWLVDYCIDNDAELPLFVVQSANPVGKENIMKLLNNYNNFRK